MTESDRSQPPLRPVLRRAFLGFTFDTLELDQAIARVSALSKAAHFTYVVTPNVDHVVQLHKSSKAAENPDNVADDLLHTAYGNADLTLCDSRILGRLAGISRINLPIVPGSDLTRHLLETGLENGTLAVIGGDSALHDDIAKKFPRFSWRFHQPPMGVRRNPAARKAIADFIEETQADTVLFAIGAPQSEICCAEIKATGSSRGVALCIGASLEFLTGAKQRAPLWMQSAGLEWLFRLASEPRRLWRRYLVEGPQIFRIWRQWKP